MSLFTHPFPPLTHTHPPPLLYPPSSVSVGVAIIEFIIFSSLCPLRGLFRQLKERDTVSITQLRNAGKARPSEYKNLIQ